MLHAYYPVPSNSISFWDIPFLPPLPNVQMNNEDQERMREWARNNRKSVRQSVRKKATNRGKIHFAIPSAHDLDETS